MFQHNPKDLFLIGFFLLVVLASTGDIIYDISHGVGGKHIFQESILLLLGLSALFWLIMGVRRQRNEITSLTEDLNLARQQSITADHKILQARQQMGAVIAQQFEDWQLSKSEKEVGLFLLKGLSLKEIAGLRGTTEKTVRQQASAIYQKANVSGRHAFSAWFIEDFL